MNELNEPVIRAANYVERAVRQAGMHPEAIYLLDEWEYLRPQMVEDLEDQWVVRELLNLTRKLKSAVDAGHDHTGALQGAHDAIMAFLVGDASPLEKLP